MGITSPEKRILCVMIIFAMLLLLPSCKKEDEGRMLEYEIKLAELNLEKQSLIAEKRLIREGIDAASGHNSYMSFIFTAVDSGLYDDVFPIFEDGEVKLVGVMALSEDELPGMDGNISISQYESLIEHGWDTALYWKGSEKETEGVKALSLFLENMSAALSSIGIDLPVSIVFGGSDYIAEYDPILESYEIENVLHGGENDFPLINNERPIGIWRAGNIGWRDLQRSTRLKYSVESNGGYSTFRIGFDNSEENYSTSFYPIDGESTLNGVRTEVFIKMTDKFKNSISAGTLHVSGISSARDGIQKYYEIREQYSIESEKKIAEIDVKLREVERKIAALYDEYF